TSPQASARAERTRAARDRASAAAPPEEGACVPICAPLRPPRRSAGDGSEGRVPPSRPSAARLSARAPPQRGPAREGAASVIHLHGELDAAVHADAVGAGLNRIPVTEVRQVIDVEQEGEAAQVERTVGDHPARAGRVEDVSGNLALLLEIDVPAGDA